MRKSKRHRKKQTRASVTDRQLKPRGVKGHKLRTIHSAYTEQHSSLKINSKGTTDLHVRANTLRLLEETEKIFATLGQTEVSQEPQSTNHPRKTYGPTGLHQSEARGLIKGHS